MSTPFSDVYWYCLVAVDDERLNELKEQNPALLYRKLWLYLKAAIPKFTKPKGMQARLKYVAPTFTDKQLSGDGETSYFDTGVVGMDLAIAIVDGIVAKDAIYDAETGGVAFTAPPADKADIDIDFYKDGYFLNDLNDTVQSIIGTCFEYVWHTRFINNWLGMTPKAMDKNFKMPNEANKIKADTERAKYIETKLSNEMADYEQTLAYERTVPQSRKLV